MPPTRLYVVDDHDVVRDGLRLYVEGVPDLRIVGECASVAEAVRDIARLEPDVAIVDMVLPDGEGVDVIRSLAARELGTAFVVFTTYESHEVLSLARAAGAAGYLCKDAPRSRLLEAVRDAAAGRADIRTTPDDRSPVRPTPLDELFPDLTAQECRIARMIAAGETNREIGDRLGVTERTARNYVSTILAKLGLRNRTEVAVQVTRALAAQRGRHHMAAARELAGLSSRAG